MKVLLLGAGGMLGRDLAATVPAGIDLVAATRAELDIADPAGVERRLVQLRPRWVINAAAYTQVDRAESEADTAMLVNGAAVTALAGTCARLGIALAHYSTDYVFSGDAGRPYLEDDATSPLGAYGRSKLLGEVGIRASGAEHLLLRTQWLFGEHGRSFPRTMWERATRGQATKVVNDQWGRPTYTPDLAEATWRLLASSARGTLHLTNSGEPATCTMWRGSCSRWRVRRSWSRRARRRSIRRRRQGRRTGCWMWGRSRWWRGSRCVSGERHYGRLS